MEMSFPAQSRIMEMVKQKRKKEITCLLFLSGTYDVEIQADEAGPHKVDLFLRNKEIPSHIEHIKDFPKTIVVEAGVSAEKTLVHGPGLEDGILDTQPAEFYIETRDSHGRPIGAK